MMNNQFSFSKPSAVTSLLITFNFMHTTRSFIPLTKVPILSQAPHHTNRPALPSTKDSNFINMMLSQPHNYNQRTVIFSKKKEKDDLSIISSIKNISSSLSKTMNNPNFSLIYICCALISFLTVPFFTGLIFNALFLGFSLFGRKALEMGDENFNDDTEINTNPVTDIISFIGAAFTTYLIAPPAPFYTYTTSSVRTIESTSYPYTSSILTYESSSFYQSNDISVFPVVFAIATICLLILSTSQTNSEDFLTKNDAYEKKIDEELESESTIILEMWDQKMKNAEKRKYSVDEKEKQHKNFRED